MEPTPSMVAAMRAADKQGRALLRRLAAKPPTFAVPELYRLKLQVSQYPYKRWTFKDVIVDLFKPHARVEDLPNYPFSEMIEDWQDGPRDMWRGYAWLPLDVIAQDFFTLAEIAEVECVLAAEPDPFVTLLKKRVSWPIHSNIATTDFGGYGPSSLSLQLTDTIEGYAYSLFDFETIDGQWFDQADMDALYVVAVPRKEHGH